MTSRDLEVGGERRSYKLYRPSRPPAPSAALPLMVLLHGGLGNADAIERTTAMSAVAEREGFLVAYPEGTAPPFELLAARRTWNAGNCCGPAVRRNSDDVGFIAALIDDVAAAHAVDRRRVYAVGMSNGAMMAYRLASEIPERIAAVVAVAGTLAVEDCSRAKDVPVLHIHGDRDPNVPFAGGRGELGWSAVEHRSVPDTLARLVAPRKSGGCERALLNDGVERWSYRCSAGAPVELLLLRGAGHEWPGGRRRDGEAAVASALSASETAWSFARRFEKESEPSS